MIQTFDIYISGRNSVSSLYSSSNNRRKHNFQYTRTTNLPYQLSSLFKKKKKSSFKSSIYFPFFSTNYSVLSRLKWETDSLGKRGEERRRKKERERKKRGRGRIETESETMYIQAVRSRSKRLNREM